MIQEYYIVVIASLKNLEDALVITIPYIGLHEATGPREARTLALEEFWKQHDPKSTQVWAVREKRVKMSFAKGDA